jgi:hypothetical protein
LKGESLLETTQFYTPQDKKEIQLLNKYSEMSSVVTSFNIDQINKEHESIRDKKLSLNDSFKERVELSAGLSKTINLYSADEIKITHNIDYQLSENELYWLQKMFENSPDSKHSLPSVLSYIYLKDENNLQMNKINEGGFADIFTS